MSGGEDERANYPDAELRGRYWARITHLRLMEGYPEVRGRFCSTNISSAVALNIQPSGPMVIRIVRELPQMRRCTWRLL